MSAAIQFFGRPWPEKRRQIADIHNALLKGATFHRNVDFRPHAPSETWQMFAGEAVCGVCIRD
jgi:hypothetical protein